MTKMTREDMLRELELLPVWQLRQPLLETAQAPAAPDTLTEIDIPAVPVQATKEASVEPVLTPQPLRALPSEDGRYLFLMQPAPALPDEAAEQLLQNMLRAMHVIARTDMLDTVEHIFTQHAPKLIICLGTETANLLLGQSFEMQAWRRQQTNNFKQTPVIVSFAPQYLLQHTQDKALAWQDLCLAMQLVQGL